MVGVQLRQQPAKARPLYGEAPAASRIADNRALPGHAFGCLTLAEVSGRPREAIAAAQAAQSAVRTCGSPRRLSLMAMCETGGWILQAPEICPDDA